MSLGPRRKARSNFQWRPGDRRAIGAVGEREQVAILFHIAEPPREAGLFRLRGNADDPRGEFRVHLCQLQRGGDAALSGGDCALVVGPGRGGGRHRHVVFQNVEAEAGEFHALDEFIRGSQDGKIVVGVARDRRRERGLISDSLLSGERWMRRVLWAIFGQ